MNTRQRWIALALIVTLAAAFWPGSEDSDERVETARRVGRQAAPATVPVSILAKPGMSTPQAAPAAQERLAKMQANLFPRQTWVPPPKPYIPPPPPPPKPPPLPFKYMGRWVEGGQQTVFLLQGEQPIPIQAGQVLQGSWRVDEISDRQVMFTYLPLDMQSALGITP